jgi:hypothetical protein
MPYGFIGIDFELWKFKGVIMQDSDESRKPYVEPTLEKREKLVEITEGVVVRVSGNLPRK